MILKKYNKDLKLLYTSALFLLVYLQPGITNSLLKIINCKKIEDNFYLRGALHY